METITTTLLWFATILAGIMAGVYFTFSVFVMRSLDAMTGTTGMAAMQSINRVILKSAFLPLFFLSSLACATLVVIALLGLSEPGATAMLAGAGVYVVGMFVVTAVGNVPLNNRLEATDAAGPEAKAMWAEYVNKWTALNHVRTVACTACAVLLTLALIAR